MINNLVYIVIIASLFFGFATVGSLAVVLKLKNTKMLSQIAQLAIDKQAILEELDKASFISKNSVDIENGFIKFLSESRNSAFEYIENVQLAILDLKEAMLSGDENQISVAYNNLTTFLPSDSTDKVS